MNNTCYHLVQSQPPQQPIASPSPVLEWGILITAAITGIGALCTWGMKQYSKSQQSESDLMKGLISNLQDVQGQLIRDSKEAKLELISHIDLKDTLGRATALLKDDVSRALQGQTGMYVESLKNQGRMEQKIDAALRQGDEIKVLIQQIKELIESDSNP